MKKICKIVGCTNYAKAIGLCAKHYTAHNRCGDYIGVYMIRLADKIYIGSSITSINARTDLEKNRLINNNCESVSKNLLDYFNELCMLNPELSRKEVADKYFSVEILELGAGWSKLEDFKDKMEKRKLLFAVRGSTNKEVIRCNKLAEIYLRRRESSYIRKYKQLDIQNGTSYCLNIKD